MDKIVGLITTNYGIKEMDLIAGERTLSSLPYGSRYRIIDFPLSNMVNSGINTVGIITPYKYRSIIDHIGTGSEWSLDRKRGGLFILPGSIFGVSNSEARFMIRDFELNITYLHRSPAPYVLVTAGSVVSNMDYTGLYDAHKKSGADITMVYNIAKEDDEYLCKIDDTDGKVNKVSVGVKEGDKEFLDCFIINREKLLDIVEWYQAVNFKDLFDAIEDEYDKIDVRLYEFTGYYGNVFSVKKYFRSCMDPLNLDINREIFNPDMPVLTKGHDTAPTKYNEGCKVKNSLIPAGCTISGTVEDSVLFRNVVVEEGAVIKNSIIMQKCVIKAGAVVENAIIDMKNVIQEGIVVKGSKESIYFKEKNDKWD